MEKIKTAVMTFVRIMEPLVMVWVVFAFGVFTMTMSQMVTNKDMSIKNFMYQYSINFFYLFVFFFPPVFWICFYLYKNRIEFN